MIDMPDFEWIDFSEADSGIITFLRKAQS